MGCISWGPVDFSNEVKHALKIYFILFYFIEVQLIHNVVLISAVQQSDSVIHMYTFFFILFSIMVYHRILNRVPCAIQSDLVVYSFYI